MLRQTFHLPVTLLLILTAPRLHAADAYWPGWLGPDRNGWVSDFEPPAKWPAELTKSWSKNVGEGYGSPVVADGRIYQHARQGEEEVVWCLDLRSGEVKWRKTTPAPFRVRGGGEFHGAGPKGCPVFADGRLFTLSISGDLIAWNAKTGDVLWKSNYGRKYPQNHPHWGTSTSPLVDGDRIVMHFGNDDQGELVALNVETGAEMWSVGNDGASYSSPLLVDLHGVPQIVEWNHNSVAGVECETGKLLWSHPFAHSGSNQNMPTPTFHNGTILVGGENRGLHCLQPQLDNETWSVTKIWSQDKVALDMSSTIVNDGLLYGMSHYGKGRMFCVNPQTGEVLWQTEGRFGQNATFLAIPGQLVALNDTGTLQAIKTSGEAFSPLAKWKVSDQPTWAPPVLLQEGVLVKDRETLTFWAFSGN